MQVKQSLPVRQTSSLNSLLAASCVTAPRQCSADFNDSRVLNNAIWKLLKERLLDFACSVAGSGLTTACFRIYVTQHYSPESIMNPGLWCFSSCCRRARRRRTSSRVSGPNSSFGHCNFGSVAPRHLIAPEIKRQTNVQGNDRPRLKI